MYEVKVLGSFSSAHHLRNYNGKCEAPHGHNWQVEVICRSAVLNSIGLVIDFKVLKKYMNNVLDSLDHKDINEIEYFKNINPSSENIATYIFKELAKALSDFSDIDVYRVNVWETNTSCASYFESEG